MNNFVRGRHLFVITTLLVGIVLLFLTILAGAATFDIANGDVTALVNAITTANGNGETDTINLATGGTYTLTLVNNETNGANGLPSITSAITINGNGATIQRSSVVGTPTFRIFHVAAGGGNLTLNSVFIGKQGVGGVTFFNGTIINETTDPDTGAEQPVTFGDDVRIDGEIWRGTSKGTADNIPLKISDTVIPTLTGINDLGSDTNKCKDIYYSGTPIAQLKMSNIQHIAAVSPTVSPSTQVVYGSTGGTATYTIIGGVAPYNVMTNDSNFPPSPAAVTDSGGTFIVTVPGNSTAKTVTYTVKDSANKTTNAQLSIVVAQEGWPKETRIRKLAKMEQKTSGAALPDEVKTKKLAKASRKDSSKIRLIPLPFPKDKAFLIGANVPLGFETWQKPEKLKYEFMRSDGKKLSPKETPRFLRSKTSKGAGKVTITQHVKFSEPGKYRYRCSPDGGKSWSGWQEIMVKEPDIKARGKLKMKSASTAGKKVAKKTENTRKMPKLGAPLILNLKTGKVFTAQTDITLKAKHHSAYCVVYKLQKKNSKGRYVPFKTSPDGKFSNLKAGEYRVCIAYNLKGALPGKGIEFIVEEKKLKVKKMPSVKQKKMPSIKQKVLRQ